MVVRPNPFGGRTLADPILHGLWAACERYAMALCIHDGIHGWNTGLGDDRFASSLGRHACSHPMEAMMAFLSLYEGRVFERFPRLRVAFLESGAGWVPYWLRRLDHEVGHWGSTAGARAPSACFRDQCMVSMEPDEPEPAAIVRALGADSLLFGSDFPHLDHDADALGQMKALAPAIGEDALDRILRKNPARLLGLG